MNQLVELAELNLNSIIDRAKSNICVVCKQNQIDKNPPFLPCGCHTCDNKCTEIYFMYVFRKAGKSNRNQIFCFCGYYYNNNDFKQLYEYVTLKKKKDLKKDLEKAIIANFLRCCLLCLEDSANADDNFHILKLKDKEIANLYKIKEFRHLICGPCYSNRNDIKE